jgi:Fe-S cluster assembly protein SufD
MLTAKQHSDNHTLVDHAMPNCYSNELYKGVLNDKSTGVFNGKIYVKPDAQKTNAFQSNKNILLSKDAVMNTKPQLEIYADDVKCSHGATVGQMDEEPLFYLRARGIPEKSARALLVNAFASDIIEHIKIESLKERLLELISAKLLPE